MPTEGYMLGKASCYCGCCNLPQTLTVTLDGLAEAFPDVSRLQLDFSSCAGSGASGYVDAPSLHEAPGPISGPILTSGGSGYATIGRVEPTLTGDGNATVSVTMTEDATGPCGWPVWRVSAVSVTTPGSAIYTDNAAFYVGYGGEVTQVLAASLRVRTYRDVPTLTIDDSGASGTGAAITLTTTAGTDFEGRDSWAATGYTIDTAGTGYAVDDYILIGTSDGVEITGGLLRVTTVGGSGEITGLSIDDGGQFFLDTGEANDIEIDDGGEYYEEDPGEPVLVASVTVTPSGGGGTGGTVTATVDDDPDSPTFGEVISLSPGAGGSGYNGENTQRPCCGTYLDGRTFVVQLVATSNLQCRNATYVRPPDGSADINDNFCRYSHTFCTGVPGALSVSPGVFSGPQAGAIDVYVRRNHQSYVVLSSAHCSTLFASTTTEVHRDGCEFEAVAANGATASVTAGGTYDEYNQMPDPEDSIACHECCGGDELPPEEVTVSFALDTVGARNYAREAGFASGTDAAVDAWVAANWGPYEGDYVLDFTPGTGLRALYWEVLSPLIVTARITPIAVRGEPVPSVGPNYPWEDDQAPDGSWCNTCNQQCRTVLTFNGWTTNDLTAGCEVATNTPMCRPPEGSYPLLATSLTTHTIGTVTVSYA